MLDDSSIRTTADRETPSCAPGEVLSSAIPSAGPSPVHDVNDWVAWQLVDSAFPTGGYAHSNGLEAAWQHGAVRNGQQLNSFAKASLEQLGHSALPFVSDAWSFPEQLVELDHLCQAFTTNHVANRASRLQGRAFFTALSRIFFEPRELSVGFDPPFSHLAPVFGAGLVQLGLARDTVQRLFLFGQLRSLMAAAMRLNIVGPMEAQRIQAGLASEAEGVLEKCAQFSIDNIAQTAPLLDLWQGTHDRLDSRLFQS